MVKAVVTCLMSANHVPSLPVESVVGNGYRLPIGESAGGGDGDGDGGRSLTESNSRQSVQSQSAAGGKKNSVVPPIFSSCYDWTEQLQGPCQRCLHCSIHAELCSG